MVYTALGLLPSSIATWIWYSSESGSMPSVSHSTPLVRSGAEHDGVGIHRKPPPGIRPTFAYSVVSDPRTLPTVQSIDLDPYLSFPLSVLIAHPMPDQYLYLILVSCGEDIDRRVWRNPVQLRHSVGLLSVLRTLVIHADHLARCDILLLVVAFRSKADRSQAGEHFEAVENRFPDSKGVEQATKPLECGA